MDAVALKNFVPLGFPGLPPHWRCEGRSISSADGQETLFLTRYWQERAGAPQRAMLIAHGQGEHGGRYQHFAHFLNETVGSIVTIDHRGHGRSTGARGHVERFDDYVEDASAVAQTLKLEYPSQEWHLFGHSMGGLISLRLLWKHPEIGFKSAVISAPLLGLSMKVPALKKWMAMGISRVWGSLSLKNEIDARAISRDGAVQEAYLKDGLNHNRVTPRFFVEMQRAIENTLKEALRDYRCPLLFLIPGNDRVVDSQTTRSFVERLQGENPVLIESKGYPESHHESFNDTDKETVFRDIAQWIRKNSASSS